MTERLRHSLRPVAARCAPRRLHEDRGGQITFLTLFGAVALAGLLGLVMTTGDQTSLQIQGQNAADAAALSGGAWIARGLNVTSAANVAESQLASAAIVLQALDDTLRWSIPFVEGQRAAYELCTPFFPPCAIGVAITTAQLVVLRPVADAVRGLAKTLAACPDGIFWRFSRLLQHLAAVTHTTFFGIAAAETLRVARAGGAEEAYFVPGGLFYGASPPKVLTLPTEEKPFQELCPPMTEGSPTPSRRGYGKLLGYPLDQGPFRLGRCRLTWVASAITGFPPAGMFLMPALSDLYKARYCGGSNAASVRPKVQRPAEDLDECRRQNGRARWRVVDVHTHAVSARDGCGWLAGRPKDEQSSGVTSQRRDRVERSCRDTPPGRPIGPSLYCRSTGRERAGKGKWRHDLETWSLESAWVEEGMDVQPSAGSCSEGTPKPYLLRREPGALHYLVLTHRPNRRVFFTAHFQEPPPPLVHYAQVQIYNGVSEDTFSQDWHVRLERADLLERPLEEIAGSPSGTALSWLLGRFGSSRSGLVGALDAINNH